jgi:uncharacterized protein (DUF983 family)
MTLFDKTDADGRTVNAEQLRALPDEKLTEIAACAKGFVKHCPECGTVTAFAGTPTFNCESECHECGHSVSL